MISGLKLVTEDETQKLEDSVNVKTTSFTNPPPSTSKMEEANQAASPSADPEKNSGPDHQNDSTVKASKNFTRDPVDIHFNNVSYTVNLGFRKGTKTILHGVSGRLLPSSLVAIMGPSGAGKSTLLDILSGYRVTGVEGAVYINGRGRDMQAFKRMSCYITQDDRLQGLLTVGENMYIAADLKLPPSFDKYDRGEIVEEILTTLGLYDHIHTQAARLSGGQKKRLSIALELINNPLVMFLDEPTTGLDSSSCTQVLKLCRSLASQGRTIICTVHQPSASLFALFEQVFILAAGHCLYQGSADKLVPYLQDAALPCPLYHNPADYVIELASGEYGEDKIERLTTKTENGRSLEWFKEPEKIPDMKMLRTQYPLSRLREFDQNRSEEITQGRQRTILIRRGFLKAKRDATLTHLRIAVNICTGIMLGSLFINAGNEGSRILDNYNLLFAILMHHMMSTMMLTILTFPSEMSILSKEHFNRWYSLSSYYISITLVDLPLSCVCCFLFSVIVYTMSAQPLEINRFSMFFTISMFVVLVAQSFGLMIGAVFSVVNGTFLGPTLSVPMMMFAGFGVTLRDLPPYLKWGSWVSYLRYGLEGYVGAIYGLDRPILDCEAGYCHYKYPDKFLREISMSGDMFWWDVLALSIIVIVLRIAAYILLRWKLMSVR